MKEPLLEQALHGYTQGHGLIAASPGVSAEERALLDRLSDLSGYLPSGLSFDRYHTGFPCGRYYALCCTWPDPSAPRGGAVMTHSLLIPRAALARPDLLERTWATLRRPTSVRAPGYDQRLELAGPTPGPAPPFGGDRARAAVVLLFGAPARPIVWVDPTRPDDVVRGLWALLWPEARQEFSFCTMALSPRQVAGRVFTLLGVPPEARGAFSNLGAHPAWWDQGRLRDQATAARAAEPWVDQVVHGGAPLVTPIIDGARAAGLAPLPEDLPLLLRLDELARGARERLTAARSRADLLASRLPHLPATHLWWREALAALLERQPDAPLKPRPLWDLTDLLGRPQTAALAVEERFRGQIEDVLVAELSRRLQEAPLETCEGLPALLAAAEPIPGLGDALGPALGRAVSRAQDLDQAVRVASAVLAKLDSGASAVAALGPLPEEARPRATVAALAAGKPGEVARRSLAAADRLSDVGLAFAVGTTQGGTLDGLKLAARIVARAGPSQAASFDRLLAEQEAEVALSWALGNAEPALAGIARTAGGRAVDRLGLKLVDVGQRCLGQPGGPEIFFEVARQAPRDELLAAATASPALADLVLEHAERSPSRDLARALAQGLPSLLERGELPPEGAARWLGSSAVRDALGAASRWSLFPGRGRPGPGLLVPLVEAVNLLSPQVPIQPMIEPLALALQAADRGALERATEGLAALLARPMERDDRAMLLGETLGAVGRLRPSGGPELIRLCFPAVYPAVRDGIRFPFNLLSWWFDAGWDRAKRWRHWLVDAWLDEGWAPIDLIRVIDATSGSERLFAQVAKRAWKTRHGEAMMRRALAQLGDAPELAARWRAPLERLLREGPPWVDHD